MNLTEEQKERVSAMAREIVETVNKTAISLAVCRHGLIREAEDDENVLPDEAEDEIIQDVLDCLTGEETGCLDPEELDAENCAVLMVQDRLNRAATLMRDKCVSVAKRIRDDYIATASVMQDDEQIGVFSGNAAVAHEIIIALESLTLDTQEKQS